MGNINELMKCAGLLGACSGSEKVTDYRSLVWMFFSPQGREFCEKNNFPDIEMFRSIKEDVNALKVLVDAGTIVRENDAEVGIIGQTDATLIYDDPERVHKIILMHGAKARIKASGYAVILLVNIGNCELEIEKDETAIIL